MLNCETAFSQHILPFTQTPEKENIQKSELMCHFRLSNLIQCAKFGRVSYIFRKLPRSLDKIDTSIYNSSVVATFRSKRSMRIEHGKCTPIEKHRIDFFGIGCLLIALLRIFGTRSKSSIEDTHSARSERNKIDELVYSLIACRPCARHCSLPSFWIPLVFSHSRKICLSRKQPDDW